MQPRGAEGEVGQGRKTHNLGSYLCSIYELSGAWHTMIHFQDPSLESEIILKNAWFDLKTTSNDIKKLHRSQENCCFELIPGMQAYFTIYLANIIQSCS